MSVIFLVATGCALRPGMNANCEWPPDAVHSSDARHLVDDVRVAEELAIRYADADGKLKLQWRTRLVSCTDDLFATIAGTHAVPREQVLAVRAWLDAAHLDVAAVAPMLAKSRWAARTPAIAR